MGAPKTATNAPAIVAARTAMATNQAPPAPSMAVTQTPPTTPMRLSDKWLSQSGGTVKGLANSLASGNLIDRGGAMQIGLEDIKKPTAVKLAITKTKGGVEPKTTSSQGTEGSAMFIATEGLRDIFDAAQAANIKSGQQFKTAFNDLIIKSSPKAQALYKDPKFKEMLPNFVDVAANKYAELLTK